MGNQQQMGHHHMGGAQTMQGYGGGQYVGHHPMQGEVSTDYVVMSPDLVMDQARGGYWVREVENGGYGGYGISTAGPVVEIPSVQGGERIIKKTEWCDDDEPVMIRRVKKHRKVVESSDSESSEDETVVIQPPPIYVQPPPVYVMCPPPEPRPKGPTTFFPLVRARPYRLETQQRGACVAEASCSSGGCGGGCQRCGASH